tara:strand:+ start:588 stop:2330 length:1743 start_codon:yes stop_codon:yes gene_type:complete
MARKNTTKIQAAIRATIGRALEQNRLVLSDDDLEFLEKSVGRNLTDNNVLDFVSEARKAGIDSPTKFSEISAFGSPEGRMEKGTLPQFPEREEGGKFKFTKPDSSAGTRGSVSRATPSVAEKDLRNVNSVFGGLPVRTSIANAAVKPLNITEEGAHLIVEMMKEEADNRTVNVSPANPRILNKASYTLQEIDTLQKVPLFSSPVSGPLVKIKLLHDALLGLEEESRALSKNNYTAHAQVKMYRAYMEESPSKLLPRLPFRSEINAAFKSNKLSPHAYLNFITELRTGLEKMFPDMLTAGQSMEDNARVLSHALHQAGFLVDADPSLDSTKREYIKGSGVFNPAGDQLSEGAERSYSRGKTLGSMFTGTELRKYPGEGLVGGQKQMLSEINNGGLSVPVGRSERTGKVVFEPSGVAPIQYGLNEEKAANLKPRDVKEIFKNADAVVPVTVVNDLTPIAPPQIAAPPVEEIQKPKTLPAPVEEKPAPFIEQPEEDGRRRKKTRPGKFSRAVLPFAGGFLGTLLSGIDYAFSATPTARDALSEIEDDKMRERAERDELIPKESELRGRTMEEVKNRTPSFMNQ